jgi:DNA-binding CsgD family transcriptional regulator
MAIEIAGAEKGYLIMIDGAQELDIHHALVMTPHSLEQDINMSRAMVRYVIRTLEPVVLNDVEQADIFPGDSYIRESRTKSIACWPLVSQGIPGGIIYLENSFLAGVFTPERLEILKLIIVHVTYVMKLHSLFVENEGRTKDERPVPLIEPLTERERQVLRLIADGMSNQEIAEELQLTVSTVKSHVLNIYGKLRVNRRIQAVTRAKELRLIKSTL